MHNHPKPPFAPQHQPMPGTTSAMDPVPDHGESTYVGHGRLSGKRALITGGDSGIGRAVAIAYAREGADVAIGYLNEEADAQETARLVREAGQEATLLPGNVGDADTCRKIVERAVSMLGCIDILVNNAAHQATIDDLGELSDAELEHTFQVNILAMFRITKAALPHMKAGASIINTASVNADKPNPSLLAYAVTKGAIQTFSGGLAQMLADRGIRVNCVAPGPIWTPLIPSTMPPEKVKNFGEQVPMQRPGQPGRACRALRHAGLGRSELRFWGHDRGHGRTPHPLRW